MTEESIFENHSALNSFMVLNGYHVDDGLRVSEYITIVKAKKIIRQLSDEDLGQLNETVFGQRLNKYNALTKEKLFDKLDKAPFIRVLRTLYVRDTDGVVDALLCLMNKKVYRYDYRFLNYYFKHGHEPEDTTAGR